MKTRKGFVSNSSSSSFILNLDIDAVARNMLSTVIEEFSDWDREESASKRREGRELYKTWRENLEKGLRKRKVKNGEIGLTFPSCNEDTYIVKKNNQCYVATCNNHMWDDIILDGGTQYGEDNETVYSVTKRYNYFNIRNCKIHSCEKFWDDFKGEQLHCRHCTYQPYSYVIDLKGKILCGTCYRKLGEDPDVKERKRLKEILSQQPKFPSPFNDLEI
jgi:hypothetical protein